MEKVKTYPWPVGTRIRFVGPNEFAYNDKWVRTGDIGLVEEVHSAQQPSGIMVDFGDGPQPDPGLDGWSTVRFPSGCRVALHFEDRKNPDRWAVES